MQRWARAVLVLGMVAAGLPGTGRAEYWKYTKDDGSTGFADERKQVPARYREQAVRCADQSLAQYSRYTPAAPPRRPEAARATAAQVLADAAREEAAQERAQQSGGGEQLLVEVAPGITAPVSLGDGSAGPLRTERTWRWYDGRYRLYTIVRLGDRVISETEELTGHVQNPVVRVIQP
jgi:hypothetical protein